MIGCDESLFYSTVPSTAPTAPISMSVSAVTSSSITVQWETVVCIQHIEKITGYSVSCEREGSETVQTMIVSGDSATEATISGLNSSTVYTIKVAAINSVSVGEYSSKSAETEYGMSTCSLNISLRKCVRICHILTMCLLCQEYNYT